MMLDASVMPTLYSAQCRGLQQSIHCLGANSATSEILVQLACAWSPAESELPKNQSLPTIESFLKELIMMP